MATKKENITHQLKSAIYDQYYAGKGTSRHLDKRTTGEYAQHAKIYARESNKTHLSRAKQFGIWLRSNHPEVRNLDDISRSLAGEYLQYQQDLGKSTRTIEADMTMINHIKIGRNDWSKDQGLTKKEFNLNPRRAKNVTNNRGVKASTKPYNEYQKEIIEFGQIFGLRKSELVPNRQNNGYAVGSTSLYEKDGRVFLAAVGKGGRYRTIEALESRQDYIREQYGQYIQKVESLPDRAEFRANYDRKNQLFDSISNNVRIHVDCRQFYANEKLNEIEKSGRRFDLLPQNKLKSGLQTYTTNGREMLRDHAQFISQQLGHNRIYELKSYVNLN